MSECFRCHGRGKVINPAWLTLAHHEDIDEMNQHELAMAFIDHGYSEEVQYVKMENGRGWYMLPEKSLPCPVCDGEGMIQEAIA